MMISKHFSLKELTYTSHKEYLESNIIAAKNNYEKILKLAEFAESVRKVLNCPMIITSGYRCERLNSALGGSKTSQHVKFEAIDFIPKGMGIDQALHAIVESGLSFGQLIDEQTSTSRWIHISMGDSREYLVYRNGMYMLAGTTTQEA